MSSDPEAVAEEMIEALEAKDEEGFFKILNEHRDMIDPAWIGHHEILYVAVIEDMYDIAAFLVRELKADPNGDGNGAHILTTVNTAKQVKFLIGLGADPSKPGRGDIFFHNGVGYKESVIHYLLRTRQYEQFQAAIESIQVLPQEIPGRGYLSYYTEFNNAESWPYIKSLCEKGCIDLDGKMLTHICASASKPMFLRLCDFLCDRNRSGQTYPVARIDSLLDYVRVLEHFHYIPFLYRLTEKRFEAANLLEAVAMGRDDVIRNTDESVIKNLGKKYIGTCIAKAVEFSSVAVLSALFEKTRLGLKDADFRYLLTDLLPKDRAAFACKYALVLGSLEIGMFVLSRPDCDLSDTSVLMIINNDPNVELLKIEALFKKNIQNDEKTSMPALVDKDIIKIQNRPDIFESMLRFNMIGPFSLVSVPLRSNAVVRATNKDGKEISISDDRRTIRPGFLTYLVEESQKFIQTRQNMGNLSLVQMVASRVQPPANVAQNEHTRIPPDAYLLIQQYLLNQQK